MCLDRVTKRYTEPDAKVRTGWKVFYKTARGDYKFEYRRLGRKRVVPTGKWITAMTGRQIKPTYSNSKYTSGFHIYLEDQTQTAESFGMECVEVKYKNPTCRGFDRSRKVVVAEKLLVPTPVKKGKR